jgi:hypothetical protein
MFLTPQLLRLWSRNYQRPSNQSLGSGWAFVLKLLKICTNSPVIGPGRVSFPAYVEQVSGLELHAGDTVTMANLSAHRVSGVREAIEALGTTLVELPAMLV